MDRSLKAALYFGVVICLFRILFHALQAIHPIPQPQNDINDGHIDDAGAYGFLALIICFALYRFRPKK
jgi:hypothetical protein